MTPKQAKKYDIQAIQGRRTEWHRLDQVYNVVNKKGIITELRKNGRPRWILYEDGFCVNDPWAILIWLPRIFDDEQPERGLFGMVNDLVGIYQKKPGGNWYCFGYDFECQADTPTNALLQAIAEQNKP